MVLALAAASPPALPVVVAFGDSITEGYGVARGDDYPAQLERALAQRGVKVRMVNAGVSGDTTNNALDRVASVIAAKPSLVLLEFGGNDGLRGFPPDLTRKNLNEAIERLQRAGARVALIGMTLPKNYGSVYLTRFEQVFKDLSAQHKLTLIPVSGAAILGNGSIKGLMQPDGIHPTAAGYGRFVDFLLPFVTAELRAAKAAAKPRL
jgi:acyl-CoA thioesterase I